MKCLKCGLENQDFAKYCRHCGEKLIQFCWQCEHENPADSRFCEKCGIAFSGKEVSTSEEATAVPTDFHAIIPDTGILLEEVIKEYIRAAMVKTNGNQTKAAELLGMSRRQLQSRMNSYGLNSQEFKNSLESLQLTF